MLCISDRGAVIRLKIQRAQGHLECFFRLMYGKCMESKKAPSSKAAEKQTREDRLKAALKANMGRRKAQARARAAENADRGGDGADRQEKG
jgi:hypothetical protein